MARGGAAARAAAAAAPLPPAAPGGALPAGAGRGKMDPNRIIQALRGTIDPNLRIAAENELDQVSGNSAAPQLRPRPRLRPGRRPVWGRLDPPAGAGGVAAAPPSAPVPAGSAPQRGAAGRLKRKAGLGRRRHPPPELPVSGRSREAWRAGSKPAPLRLPGPPGRGLPLPAPGASSWAPGEERRPGGPPSVGGLWPLVRRWPPVRGCLVAPGAWVPVGWAGSPPAVSVVLSAVTRGAGRSGAKCGRSHPRRGPSWVLEGTTLGSALPRSLCLALTGDRQQ